MIHNRAGRKLKRTASHRKALLGNLATSLFEHKRIVTTEAKAKELRRFAEPLITRAKHALANENNKQLTANQTIDIHNRRIVAKTIRKKAVLQHLFETIAPKVEHRNGGYLRIVKLGQRRGDAGRIASIELVDFFEATIPKAKNSKLTHKHSAALLATKKENILAEDSIKVVSSVAENIVTVSHETPADELREETNIADTEQHVPEIAETPTDEVNNIENETAEESKSDVGKI